MQCVTAILFLHGAAYHSRRMHLTDRLHWNSSASTLQCDDAATRFETECACEYETVQELAYGTQRRLVTLPFEFLMCPHLGLDGFTMGQNEIPVTLSAPARGWHRDGDAGERAWLHVAPCH